MVVEVWSDVVCPWCYIGKRNLENALAHFDNRDAISVVWRSFQLDPSAPQQSDGDLTQRLADKYGVTREQAQQMHARVTAVAAEAGLVYHLDKAKPGNTFDAHRLLHLAKSLGQQQELKERFMAAYFTEGLAIGDHETLVSLAQEAGIDAERARTVLRGDEFADEVHNDIEEARQLGITGVPFFVIDRHYGISGAQPPELLLQALERAWKGAAGIGA